MKINVTKSTMPNYDNYVNMIKEIWQSRQLTNSGKFHNELENRIGEYLQVNNTCLFTNGHLALEYALDLLDRKGEIITTPFTFASTTQAIIRTGNIPIFCDIKDDFTIDESEIERLITKNTVAIVAVHVYGNVCAVEEIDKISKKYDLKVIYDAAHVFGVNFLNKGIGAYGDISMFSFHATKVFHTIEGGALTFNNRAYKEKLQALRNFGQVSPENVTYIGGNGKMDEFRAAMGLCVLEIVDEAIAKRKIVYERYITNLNGVFGIKLNYIQQFVDSNYAYFPVVFNGYHYNRDQVFKLLEKNDVIARKYFYPLTSDFSAYKEMFSIQPTPNAKHISNNILCLPIYPDLSIDDVDRICLIIKEGRLS